MNLRKLSIYGLFGQHDIVLDLSLRPLFIVGPNGTGKSTCLSILHCVLTDQWARLATLPYDHIILALADAEFTLDKDDFFLLSRFAQIFTVAPSRLRGGRLPSKFSEAKVFLRRGAAALADPERASRLEQRYGDLQKIFYMSSQVERSEVLFYPTYRRIERDLRELVDLDRDFEPIDIEPSIRERFDRFGEVIGFGGQDIQRLIQVAAAQLENAARQALNQHSLQFIDVLNKQETVRSSQLREKVTDPETVSRLLGRINALAPGSVDTTALQSNLTALRRKNLGRIRSKEEILIFYISELISVLDKVDQLAGPLQRFCGFITTYLKPLKRAEFNEKNFSVSIINQDGTPVDLDALSSGEKQILSLFSFLMFSPEPRGRVLIIDEPELSLSVSWQKRLMSDLLRTGRPRLCVCATHSPFIFEKFSLDNVQSLGTL